MELNQGFRQSKKKNLFFSYVFGPPYLTFVEIVRYPINTVH